LCLLHYRQVSQRLTSPAIFETMIEKLPTKEVVLTDDLLISHAISQKARCTILS
jgi:hypothetical protein